MLHFSGSRGLLLLLVLLFRCVTAEVQRKIHMGGAIALSGKYKSSGVSCQRGWTFWAERLNERGGIRLRDGSSVNVSLPLDLRDDESSKAKSMEVLGSMLNSTSPQFADLDFVIGPFSSGITKGNAQEARKAQRILFSHGASESLYNTGNPYIFSVLTPGEQYMASGLQLLYEQGARSVVFAHEAKSFSRSVCRGANASAHRLGMKVSGYFEYEPGKTNFADIVLTIKRKSPDIYVGCGHLDDVTFLIGNANTLNVNPQAVLVTHASDGRIIRNLGRQHSHGLLSPTQWDQNLKYQDEGFFGTAENFHRDFQERFGDPPPYQAAYAAAMGYALQKAIEHAGTLDTDSVLKSLQDLEIESFYGMIKFSGPSDPSGLVGTMPRRPMVTTQIQNGTISVVAPAAAASRTPIYPLPTWSQKALLLHPCPLGSYESGLDGDGSHICHKCQRGKYRDKDLLECSPCKPGTFAATPGASSCPPCPAGMWSGQQRSVECTQCPQGSFCSEGSSLPKPCPAGRFCENGTSMPQPCPSGSYRMEEGGASVGDCLPCRQGRYNDKAGVAECAECFPGRYNPLVGQRVCMRCPFNSYQDTLGQTNCTTCPSSFITRVTSADSVDACVCNEHAFLNRQQRMCNSCPEGAICPGGLALPLVKEGFYAQNKGDPNMPMGSKQAFSGLVVWECPKPAKNFCPGQGVTDPQIPDNVINGARLPNECPPHHMGISCALCEDGYSLQDGHCRSCGHFSRLVFVVIMSIAVISAVLKYKYVAYQGAIATAGFSILSCSLTTALSFMQFLAVLTSINFEMPEDIEYGAKCFQVFMLNADIMRTGCIFNSSFAAQYITQVAIPILIIGVFFTNWAVSVVLNRLSTGRILRMNSDDAFNACASAILAFHIPICKIAMRYFECRAHPAGPNTLIAYPAVECQSPEHLELLPVGIAAVVLYVIGIFTFMFCTMLRMPWIISQGEEYRRRFRFFYFAWRPDRWYWSMVYVLRNLLVSLVVVFAPRDVLLQCVLMLLVLIFSMTALASFLPWRESLNNNIDMLMMGCLCFKVTLSFKFVTQSTDPLSEGMQDAVTLVVHVLVFGTLVAFAVSAAYALNLKRTRAKQEQMYHDNLVSATMQFIEVGQSLALAEVSALSQVLATCPSTDIKTLERAVVLMGGKQRIRDDASQSSRFGRNFLIRSPTTMVAGKFGRWSSWSPRFVSRASSFTTGRFTIASTSTAGSDSSAAASSAAGSRTKRQIASKRLSGIFNWEVAGATSQYLQRKASDLSQALNEEELREKKRVMEALELHATSSTLSSYFGRQAEDQVKSLSSSASSACGQAVNALTRSMSRSSMNSPQDEEALRAQLMAKSAQAEQVRSNLERIQSELRKEKVHSDGLQDKLDEKTALCEELQAKVDQLLLQVERSDSPREVAPKQSGVYALGCLSELLSTPKSH